MTKKSAPALTPEEREAHEAQLAAARAARELECKRSEWRKVTGDARRFTLEAAVDAVESKLAQFAQRFISSRVVKSFDGVSLEVAEAFSVSARVEVDFRYSSRDDVLENPDKEREYAVQYHPRVEFGWPSTTRQLCEAVACVAVYRDVVEFGARLEAWLKSEVRVVNVTVTK